MTRFPDFVPEIECPECDGHGRVPTDVHPAMQCTACLGQGWRPMTQDEIEDAAEAAFDALCDGEPPVTMREQHAAAWKQKQELRR